MKVSGRLTGKYLNVIHFMKATEQYCPVVLFIMLYKVVLTFESEDEMFVLWMKSYGVTI